MMEAHNEVIDWTSFLGRILWGSTFQIAPDMREKQNF